VYENVSYQYRQSHVEREFITISAPMLLPPVEPVALLNVSLK
jgi:hypothetical protein